MSYSFPKGEADGFEVTLSNGVTYRYNKDNNLWQVASVEGMGAGEVDLPPMTSNPTADTLVLRDENANAKFRQITCNNMTFNQNTVFTNTADTWFLSGGELSNHGVKKNTAEGMRASLNIYSKDEVDALSGGDSFFTDLGNNTIQYFGNELQVTLMNDPFHVGAKLGNDISCSGRFISGTECFVGGSIGLKFDSNSSSVVPVDEMGRPKVGIDLGSTAAKFKDGDFTGEVRATAFVGDGSQLTGTVSTKALVNAFQSIQMAVSNETTVAGIKKALTNSLGGLIEKLEG
jgi:hypothetical protein